MDLSYSVEGDLVTRATDSQHGEFMELYRQICGPVAEFKEITNSRCWCDSNHAYPSLCPSMPWPNHVGRHRLSSSWTWDRSMRFRVNLKGGAFGA